MGGPEINLEASKRPRMRVASAIKISLQKKSQNVEPIRRGGEGRGEERACDMPNQKQFAGRSGRDAALAGCVSMTCPTLAIFSE